MHYLFIILLGLSCAGAGCAGSVPVQTAAPPGADSQGSSPVDSREVCLQSIRRARLDARGGQYRMYLFARDRYEARFSRFLGEYMRTRYGIELIISGEDDPDRDRCYSNEMDKILFTTFGPDILARAEQEARGMFDSGR